MRVLVTGAGGFVGRRLVQVLQARGHDVVAPTRRDGDLIQLLDGERLPDIAAIVHAAARSPGPGTGPGDFAANVALVRALAGFARRRKAGRIVHLSSLSLYGRVGVPVLDEDVPASDPDPYGASKLECETLLRAVADAVPVMSLRLPGVVGHDSDRPWLARLIQGALANRPLTIFNPHSPFNNAVHVDALNDFIAGLLQADWSGFQPVVLGTRRPLPLAEVVRLVRTTLGSASPVEEMPAPQPSFTLSTARAEQFGYAPQDTAEVVERAAREAAALRD